LTVIAQHLITRERLLVRHHAHLAKHPGRALPDGERRQSTNTSSATPAAAMIDNIIASARRSGSLGPLSVPPCRFDYITISGSYSSVEYHRW